MAIRQKVIFDCLQATHGYEFLTVISIDGLCQHVSPLKYFIILIYHLMIILFLIDEVFSICYKMCLDTFEKHEVHCKELSEFKYQHVFIRDVIFEIFWHARLSVKKKMLVNFFTDPRDWRSTLRSTNILMYDWVGRKYACLDLTRVYPLVGIRTRCFIIRQTTFKIASSKTVKHEKACSDKQYIFI